MGIDSKVQSPVSQTQTQFLLPGPSDLGWSWQPIPVPTFLLMVSGGARVLFQMLLSSWSQHELLSTHHFKTLLLPRPEFYRITAFLSNGFYFSK